MQKVKNAQQNENGDHYVFNILCNTFAIKITKNFRILNLETRAKTYHGWVNGWVIYVTEHRTKLISISRKIWNMSYYFVGNIQKTFSRLLEPSQKMGKWEKHGCHWRQFIYYYVLHISRTIIIYVDFS